MSLPLFVHVGPAKASVSPGIRYGETLLILPGSEKNASPVQPLEVFVSVDVETAGPHPYRYSLLAIGACLVSDPERGVYVEFQPVNANAVPEAMSVHGLSLDELSERGLPPAKALERVEQWLEDVIRPDQHPVFVAFNAPFDWMFVNDYFRRFLGRNPFGHSALDIKSFYMGLHGVRWSETSMKHLPPRYRHREPLTHHALHDAQDQARLFARLLAEAHKYRSIP